MDYGFYSGFRGSGIGQRMEDHPYLRRVLSLENGHAISFRLFPQEPEETHSSLRRIIQISGGSVLKAGETDVYEIKLLDLNWYLNRYLGSPLQFSDNVFSQSFVLDSYLRNERQDLNSYRLGGDPAIDANLVARRIRHWTQVKMERDVDLPSTGDPVSVPRLMSRNNSSSSQTSEAASSSPINSIGSAAPGSYESDPAKGDCRSGVPESLAISPRVSKSLEKATSPNPCLDGEAPLLSFLSPEKTFSSTSQASGSKKCELPKKAKSELAIETDETSSDEDDFQQPGKKEVTRKKFTRPRKPLITAKGSGKSVSGEKADESEKETLSKKQTTSSDCDEPKLKKHKQEIGSNPARIYSGCSPYFKAKTSGKTSKTAVPFRAVAPGSRNETIVSVSEEINASRKKIPISLDENQNDGSTESDLTRNETISPQKENIPGTVQKSGSPGVGSIRSAGVVRNQDPGRQKSVFVLHNQSSDAVPRKSARGEPYTIEEGKVLLRYICDNDFHAYHTGKRPWDWAFEGNLLKGRSASSMWEHFRKKVYPGRKKVYGCTDVDMRKFEEGENIRKRNKRAPAPSNLKLKFK